MPADASLVLQAAVTKVTSFTSTGVNLPAGTPRRGLKARFTMSSVIAGSAGHTFTPIIDASTDNTTFIEIARGPAMTTTTAAATYMRYVPFEFDAPYDYVRSLMSFSGTTGTPTCAWQADITPARP